MTVVPHNYDRIRLARVTNINYNTNLCEVRFYDRLGGAREDVHLSQPYVGRGWGILAGVEIGSLVLVGEETNGAIRLLAYLPHPHFFTDNVNEFSDVTPAESPYRRLTSGEVVLQSKPNSVVALNNTGDILLETPDGNILEIDREADLIFQQSSQREITCDAGTMTSGVVRRDVRSLEERELDVIFGGTAILGLDFDVFDETIGLDPGYPDISREGGKNNNTDRNLIPGLADPFFPEEIEDGRGSGVNISDMLNPALTEWHLQVTEFGDGNPGLDSPLLNDQARLRGHIEPNTLAEVACGTVVNEVGRQIRFDYYFGQPTAEIYGVGGISSLLSGSNENIGKGHGRAWRTYTNQFSVSWDRHFNRSNALKGLTAQKPPGIAAPGHNTGGEWTVDTLVQSPTAILFRALLHTKGADNFGRKETELTTAFRSGEEELIQQALQRSYPGSLWELAIDKEGLTKVNIPAATALENADGEPLEPFREGRSLLMNMDGDATMTIGRQKATGDFGLPRLTTDFFLNRNDYPNYGRKDRSLTLDLEGNLETHIGADNNVNQSVIMQADGSIALSVGREGDNGLADRDVEPAGVTNLFDRPITAASKATTRADRSLTGKFLGNIELQVGHDGEAGQSIMISTSGGNGFRFGKDVDDQSIQLVTTGGIQIQVQGPMQQQGYALHIDAEGIIHIVASGDIQIETEGQCHVKTQENMTVNCGASINMQAAENINLTAGGFLNLNAANITALSTASGTDSISIESGKIDVLTSTLNINAATGMKVLGSLGIAGQLAVTGGPGLPAQQLARIGDLVQVGPSIGQIITGSQFSSSI